MRFCWLMVVLLSGVGAFAEDRYVVVYRDGSVKTGGELEQWDRDGRSPRVDGHDLFKDQKNPVRMLRDRTNAPQLRGPYVAFANGDVLPGAVVGYEGESLKDNRPACLRVAVRGVEPGYGSDRIVRVRAALVSRVVMVGGQAPPMSEAVVAAMTDGRRVQAEAVGWSSEGLRVLTGSGLERVRWDEIAWVDRPDVDRMAAVLLDQALAASVPGRWSDRLVARLVTVDGAALTWPVGQMRLGETRHGGAKWPVHVVQPAWALEPLRVGLWTVSAWSFRESGEVPVSLLPARTVVRESFTGFLWDWHRNMSVRGELPASGRISGGLGVGMHSRTEVRFELPEGAERFSTWVGVSESAGDGGCVRVWVGDQNGRKRWEKKYLTGADEPVRIEGMDLKRMERLTLGVDYAHVGRPRGADPLDIRDEVVWLAPLVEIDGEALPGLAEWAGSAMPVLRAWSAEGLAEHAVVARRWNDRRRAWQWVLHVDKAGVSLSRAFDIGPGASVLIARASRTERDDEYDIEWSVGDGEWSNLLHLDNREWDSETTQEPLGEWTGQRKVIRLRVRGEQDKVRLDRAAVRLDGLAVEPWVRETVAAGMIRPDVYLTAAEPVSKKLKRADQKILAGKASDGEPLISGGVRFERGFALRDRHELTWSVPAGAKRFVAVVGHPDRDGRGGRFRVKFDGEDAVREWRYFDRNDRPVQIDTAVPAGAERITLEVTDDGGWSMWAEAGWVTER